MTLIFGYKIVQLLLSAMNGEAPRKPLVRWVQMAFTVITVHVYPSAAHVSRFPRLSASKFRVVRVRVESLGTRLAFLSIVP